MPPQNGRNLGIGQEERLRQDMGIEATARASRQVPAESTLANRVLRQAAQTSSQPVQSRPLAGALPHRAIVGPRRRGP